MIYHLPSSIILHSLVPSFAIINLHQYPLTFLYYCLPYSLNFYFYSLSFTFIYNHLTSSIIINMHLPLPSFTLINLHHYPLAFIFYHLPYRPFPSSPQPPFQSEAKCEVFFYENQFSFILKLELITIKKISHLDSL